MIWQFRVGSITAKALDKLDLNQDSILSLAEFLVLCKHHSRIIAPLRQIQKLMRKKIVHTRFWKQLATRRFKYFGQKTILEIRIFNEYDVVLLSMDYLNLRKDIVPNHYIEQWKLVQRKRAGSHKGHVEIPEELRVKYNIRDEQKEDQETMTLLQGSSSLLHHESIYVV
jgi:hypothetical protein